MGLLFMLIVVTAIAGGALYYWRQDAEQRGDDDAVRSYLVWAAKGLVSPLLIWTLFNSGWFFDALFPRISQAIAAGKWAKVFVPATASFLFYLATWWAVVTLGWIAVRVCMRTEKRMDFFATAAVWMLFALPAAFFVILLMGTGGIGVAVAVCTGSAVHGALRIAPFEKTKELPPTYSRALAKIAFDKFNEAELEIIRQLEKAESDFDGWMLLAELYAVHFHDLKTAEQTICELCDDANTTPPQVSIALNRLADWHLKLESNPVNARWALDKICERLPGTHMAAMARRRIDQLPATREEYIAQQAHGHTVKLLGVEEHQPLTRDESHGREQWLQAPEGHRVRITEQRAIPTSRELATKEASECVEQLKANPDDLSARERFAVLMAESLEQPDVAIEQLNLLLALPGQPDSQRAKWMMMLAEWHAKRRNDVDAARAALQRIITEAPQSREAFDAQRRLYLMQMDSAMKLARRPSSGEKITPRPTLPRPA